MSVQPVSKDILFYELFNSESSSRGGSQRCNRSDLFVILSHTMPRYLNVSVLDSCVPSY